MTYLIIAAALLPVAALVAIHLHLEREAKKQDLAETARFRAMNAAQRADALVVAKRQRAEARTQRDHWHRLFSGYKWGYRHNPYRSSYFTAQAKYSAACARVTKLESIIAELDGPSA